MRRRGRPVSEVWIHALPKISRVVPKPITKKETIKITPAELEVIRLIDLEGLTQEEVAEVMKTSRGTVWRLLTSARRKLAECVVNGTPLEVDESGLEKV